LSASSTAGQEMYQPQNEGLVNINKVKARKLSNILVLY